MTIFGHSQRLQIFSLGGGTGGSGGGGAPTDATYIVATANGGLSAEEVFGTTVFYPPGTLASRPAASATIVGAIYFATDAGGSAGQGILYRSDGVSVWEPIGIDKEYADALYTPFSHLADPTAAHAGTAISSVDAGSTYAIGDDVDERFQSLDDTLTGGTELVALPAAAGVPDATDGIFGQEDGSAVQWTLAQLLGDVPAITSSTVMTINGGVVLTLVATIIQFQGAPQFLHTAGTGGQPGSGYLLVGTATGDDVSRVTGTARVQTTDATVTSLFTIDPPVSSGLGVRAVVVARRQSGGGSVGDVAMYDLEGLFKDVAGTVTQVGTTDPRGPYESVAGYDCVFDTSGALMRCRVTGVAATTITWHATVDYYTLST